MNIPNCAIDNHDRIMLVGIGGGFDVFTGLPFTFKYPDKEFVLVNCSPKSDLKYRNSTETDLPECKIDIPNHIGCYSVGRHGYGALKDIYTEIAMRAKTTCILAVDGGVDSLAIGDEVDSGTILEDFIGLAALNDINYIGGEKVDKILCCAGFGSETEENLNHYRILENMGKIAEKDGFIGSFSLTKNMPEFRKYVEQCEKAWENNGRKSHIQTKIISAANGAFHNQYDDVDPRLAASTGISFVSLLASVYWMFDLDVVCGLNKVIPALKRGNTFIDSKIILRNYLAGEKALRDHRPLPL